MQSWSLFGLNFYTYSSAEFDSLLLAETIVIESVDLITKHNAVCHAKWISDNLFNTIILLYVFCWFFLQFRETEFGEVCDTNGKSSW